MWPSMPQRVSLSGCCGRIGRACTAITRRTMRGRTQSPGKSSYRKTKWWTAGVPCNSQRVMCYPSPSVCLHFPKDALPPHPPAATVFGLRGDDLLFFTVWRTGRVCRRVLMRVLDGTGRCLCFRCRGGRGYTRHWKCLCEGKCNRE